MWRWMVAGSGRALLRSIIIGEMCVRASRSLGAMTRIGIVTPGDVPVICSIFCVCTTRSRRRRPGSGSGKGRSCEGWRETAVGERWPVGGGLISHRWLPLPLPGPSGALFSLRGWGVVVAVLGTVRTRRWGWGPAGRGLTAWARSKYTAPLKQHRERSVRGMSQVKLVARGVDPLLLNVYYMDEQGQSIQRDLSYALLERLDSWKQGAIEVEGPIVVPWVFEGANLQMYPHGAGRGQWRWLLTSDLINL